MRKPKEMVQGMEELPSSVNPIALKKSGRKNFISFQPRNDKLGEGGRGQSWWCSYAELFDPLEWNFHICSLNIVLLSLFSLRSFSFRWGMRKYDLIEMYTSGR